MIPEDLVNDTDQVSQKNCILNYDTQRPNWFPPGTIFSRFFKKAMIVWTLANFTFI